MKPNNPECVKDSIGLPEGSNIVVHLLEPQEVGYQFQRNHAMWPRHITLLPWFTVPSEELAVTALGGQK